MIYFLVIENIGFEDVCQDGKERINPRGSNSTGIVVGIRENGEYRMRGKHTDHGRKNLEDQVQVLEE